VHTRVRPLSTKLFSDSVDLLCFGVGTSVFASDIGLHVRIYPLAALLLPDMISLQAA